MSEQNWAIKPGDYVRVPKGTRVENNASYSGEYNPSKRETVVKVVSTEKRQIYSYYSQAHPGRDLNWLGLVPRAQLDAVGIRDLIKSNDSASVAKLAELKASVQWLIDAEYMVQWSSGTARAEDVIRLSDEEQAAKLAEEKIPKARVATVRQRMIPKSVWKLTEDFILEVNRSYGVKENVKVARIKAGTELTVTDKHTDDYPMGLCTRVTCDLAGVEILEPSEVNNNWSSYMNTGQTKAAFKAPLKQIEKILEQVGSPPEQYFFVIRDRATGSYFRTPNYEYFDFYTNPEYTAYWERYHKECPRAPYNPNDTVVQTRAKQDDYEQRRAIWDKANPMPSRGEYVIRADQQPFEMEHNLSKAKKHTDLGKVKMTVLNFTGYFDGMGDQQAGLEEWNRGSSEESERRYPLPATFECVKFNKFTKEEVEVIDLQDWYGKTLRLRGLTIKFGSSVRGVYKKLEKAKKLDQYAYVVTFRPEFDSRHDEAPSPEQIKAVEEFIKEQLDKPVKEKDAFGISVAVASLGEAMALRLSYDGEAHVVDFDQMEEVIPQEEAQVA